jgi:hypothetical protein
MIVPAQAGILRFVEQKKDIRLECPSWPKKIGFFVEAVVGRQPNHWIANDAASAPGAPAHQDLITWE